MDIALLKRAARRLGVGVSGRPLRVPAAALAAGIIAGVTSCIRPFEDTLSELDPARRDSSLTVLAESERGTVPRGHLLESFGAFGCVSCPGAEARLSPYIHEAGDERVYIVNYHVKFGTVRDPWVFPGAQAVNDRMGFTSLPQAVMDGSNAPYGIREKDVDFARGEYDSLIARARRLDDRSFLDLRLDTASWAYDSAAGRARFAFEALNRGDAALGPLSFRALFVKNHSVTIPIYSHAWEVIVAGLAETDSAGARLAVTSLPGLTAKHFRVDAELPSEAGKHVTPPPGGPENPGSYAVLIVAEDETGAVRAVRGYRYHPDSP